MHTRAVHLARAVELYKVGGTLEDSKYNMDDCVRCKII